MHLHVQFAMQDYARASAKTLVQNIQFARANDRAGMQSFARASANYILINLQFARASARPIRGRAPNPSVHPFR